MSPAALARLATARELVVVALVDHALDALERALVVEHPNLDDPNLPDVSPTMRRARAVLRAARRLHSSLVAYTRAVDEAVSAPDHSLRDLPF